MDTSSYESEFGSEPTGAHVLNERLQILQMIEDGKITAEQGANLLASLDAPRPADRKPTPSKNGGPTWFRVRVTDLTSGKAKASVNIPLGLMDWGLKIGAQFAPEVSDLNLTQLGEMLRSGIEGKIIDVVDEEDGEHVEIFVE